MKTGLTLGILLCLLPGLGFAANTGKPVPEPLHRDILQLIQMTNAAQTGQLVANAISQQLINNLKASHPDISPKAFTIIHEETAKIFSSAATVNQLVDRLVPIFAKYYNDQDVRGMIAFYKTPLGQKVARTNPKIAQAGMQAGEAWGRGLAPELVQHIEARFKQEGIKLDDNKGTSKGSAPANR